MYRAQLIEEKDKDLFNNFICSSSKPHFLQSYEWGELKSATGWEPLRLLVWRDDRPVAAISLLKRRLPLYRYLRRSIVYAPRGPIIGKDCDQAGENYFWESVKSLVRKHGAIFIKIDPDIPTGRRVSGQQRSWRRRLPEEYRKRLAAVGFKPSGNRAGFGGVQPRYVFRLDVTPSEQELLAAMESKTRYNIHLAERKGVSVRLARDASDLRLFYDILTETAARDRFLVRSFSYFERMWDLFVTTGYGPDLSGGLPGPGDRRNPGLPLRRPGLVPVRGIFQPLPEPDAEPPAAVDDDPLGEGAWAAACTTFGECPAAPTRTTTWPGCTGSRRALPPSSPSSSESTTWSWRPSGTSSGCGCFPLTSR